METTQPVLDAQFPHLLEEARYWVVVARKRVRRERDVMRVSGCAKLQASPDLVNGLTTPLRSPDAPAPAGAVNPQSILALQNASVPTNGISVDVSHFFSALSYNTCIFF